MKTYAIRNEQNEMLIWTASHDPEGSIMRLLHFKQQNWDELEVEGYEVIEVIVMPTDTVTSLLKACMTIVEYRDWFFTEGHLKTHFNLALHPLNITARQAESAIAKAKRELGDNSAEKEPL